MSAISAAISSSRPTWKRCGTCSPWPPAWTAWSLGEAQILSQVKQAFAAAQEQEATGPADPPRLRGGQPRGQARRQRNRNQPAASEHPQRGRGRLRAAVLRDVSQQERAAARRGEMGEETLRYLREEGAQQITILNRHAGRAEELAARLGGQADSWENLRPSAGVGGPGRQHDRRARADCHGGAISVRYSSGGRNARLFVLDLAVPRDFEPAIGDFSNVYSVLHRRSAADLPAQSGSPRARMARRTQDRGRRNGPVRGRRQPPRNRTDHPTAQGTG